MRKPILFLLAMCCSAIAFGQSGSIVYHSNRVTTSKLGTASVTTPKLASDAVVESKILTGSVTTSKLGDGAVTTAKLGSDLALTGAVRIDGTTFQVDSANNRVGVGTASPQSALDVSGGSLTVRGAGAAVVVEEGGAVAAVPFRIGTSTLAVTNGRVGIGTASPLLPLDVSGAGVVRGNLNVAGGSVTVTLNGDVSGTSSHAELVGNSNNNDGGGEGAIQHFSPDGTRRGWIGYLDLPGNLGGDTLNIQNRWGDITFAASPSAYDNHVMLIKSDGAVMIGDTDLTAGKFIVTAGSTQTIAAGNTITANQCGAIKKISAASAVTTDTTNTFTAPAAANEGCVMTVINIGTAFNITLDANANFNAAADVVMTPCDSIVVASDGVDWFPVSALVGNTCN